MNIPEFTAQASLYRTSNSYRSLAFDHASPQRTVLVPQLGGPGFEGMANCISDCADTHPDWTAAQCRASCRDPGAPPPPPRDPTSRDLSIAGCWFWWGACKANPFGFGCDWVRDICLADIPR
jgi:hypothetical protein